MRMTSMAVIMVAAASARAGATPTETRQLTICMESFRGRDRERGQDGRIWHLRRHWRSDPVARSR